MNKRFVFIISFSLINSTIGFGKSMVRFDTSVASTSDHLSQRAYQVEYRNNRRNLNYPYKEEKDKAFDFGVRLRHTDGSAGTVQYSENKVVPFVGYKFSPSLLLEGGLGVGKVKNSSDQNTLGHTPLYLRGEHQGKKLYSFLEYRQDSAVDDMMFPAGIESFLRQKVVDLRLLYIHNKWRIRLTDRYHMISDDNDKFYQDVDIKYNVSTKKHWILVGAGVEYYHNKSDQNGYWTPRRFLSFGPRVEATLSFQKDWYLFAAGNLNRFIDERSQSGTGYYANLALQYGERNQNNIKLGYERIQSRQGTSLWYLDRPYLSLHYFW